MKVLSFDKTGGKVYKTFPAEEFTSGSGRRLCWLRLVCAWCRAFL